MEAAARQAHGLTQPGGIALTGASLRPNHRCDTRLAPCPGQHARVMLDRCRHRTGTKTTAVWQENASGRCGRRSRGSRTGNVGFDMPHGERADRDPARSYQRLDTSDLARLGRAAHAELDAFFARNPHLAGWRDRVRIIALAQGGAEHYLRGRRGVRDLDVIVCFAEDPRLPRLFRRMVVSWDWGPSKLGRCPHDPPDYTGRAVDVAYWVIPDRPSPIAGLREWLAGRATRHADPERKPDLAHEPVVLIHPDLGSVAWDPGEAPPPRPKTTEHRKPHGLVPP